MSTATPEPACKGCRATVRLKAGEAERILAEYLRAHPEPVATPAERARRLELCASCPALEYGTTCAHCGCLVAVRASLADHHCPQPGQPRW